MKRGRGGIEFEDLTVGDGPAALRGCLVVVLLDIFLNKGDRVRETQRCAIRLGERVVIRGLEYGIEGMREGGERRIRVGPHLAYRDKSVPGVPAHALLDIHVTLLQVGGEPPPGIDGVWTAQPKDEI